jgi:phosphatidylglycerophosphatase A
MSFGNQVNAARFMWSHPAHVLAMGLGAGLSPKAPGTVGTLWAWAAYALLSLFLTTAELGWLIAVSLPVGWWACTVTAEHMQVQDPSAIVWDEIVAFWLILWLWMPVGLVGQLVAFILFRLFDALKPGPVGWADRHFHGLGWRGGFGIMFDDIVAAFCTLFFISLWQATR